MTVFTFLFAAVAILLGALWLLQGLGLVVIEPVLCLAECTPVVGPDMSWTITGFVAIAAGCAVLAIAFRRRRKNANRTGCM